MATLHLGSRIARDIPLRGKSSGTALQHFEGEYRLSIRECAWRLDGQTQALCSWREPSAIIEQMLGHLTGMQVTAATITSPILDLTIAFEENLTLRLFCDQVGGEAGSNYAIRTPNGQFRVGPNGRLAIDDLS